MVQPGRRGTNLPRMGDYNQRVVLDQIRRSRAGVSRVELVAATGLSAQTISNVVTRLVELGLVVEGDRQILGRGKPRTMLHLRAEGGFALGAHIDPVLVTLALVDLTGAVRVQSVVETPFGPDAAVAVIAQQVAELIEAAGVDRSQILGFGVAAPGPIDADRGHVIHPPLLAGWGDYPLRDRVAQATGFETVIEKDVSAAMAAELWQGQHNLAGTTLFAYLGFGIGFAFSRHGELLPGTSRNAGEIGHLIVDADGPQCDCGNRGCIGVSASLATLVGEAVDAEVFPADTPRETPRELDAGMAALVAAGAEGNEAAIEILATSARRIAHGIMVVADLLDADHVVFGGVNGDRLEPYLLEAASTEFSSHASLRELHGVGVGGSAVGTWVGAVGAASIVLDAAFTPKASTLVE